MLFRLTSGFVTSLLQIFGVVRRFAADLLELISVTTRRLVGFIAHALKLSLMLLACLLRPFE